MITTQCKRVVSGRTSDGLDEQLLKGKEKLGPTNKSDRE